MSAKKFDRVRVRKFWNINPQERIHRAKKGEAYDRNADKRSWQKEAEG